MKQFKRFGRIFTVSDQIIIDYNNKDSVYLSIRNTIELIVIRIKIINGDIKVLNTSRRKVK